jgi:hypothetical protein
MGHVFEKLAAEVVRGADPGMSVSELAGLGAGKGDELRKRLGGYGGRNDQEVRCDEHLGDRGKILERIVGQLVIEARADHQRRVAAHEERVAVRRRLGDPIGCDVAAGAGDVLDDHRLAPAFGEPVGEETCGDVGRHARGKPDDDPDRLFRVARLGVGVADDGEGGGDAGENAKQGSHAITSPEEGTIKA